MTETNTITTATAVQPLVARTVACAPDGDLLDRLTPEGFAWLRDGAGFVTGGVAARVAAEAVDPVLRAITVHDDVRLPGTGAIAVGSLPFLGTANATMTIPAWVEGRGPDGTAWRTEIRAVGADSSSSPPTASSLPAVSSGPRKGPGATHSRCLTSRDHWERAVRGVLAAIEAGEVTKVVLARAVQVEAEAPIDPAWLLARLQDREPDRYLFSHNGSVGASPELLVSRTGLEVLARPLAGTVPWPAEPGDIDELMHSVKQLHEHAVVVDAMAATFGSLCTDLHVGRPAALRLADVVHLCTTIRATAQVDTPSALGLALALHPTPAVAGTPTHRALAHIARWEPQGRGRFAGPVGWVDGYGDGEMAVALRSAELNRTTALVRAGAGLVAGSDPDAEWTEIDAKLTPVLRALTTH